MFSSLRFVRVAFVAACLLLAATLLASCGDGLGEGGVAQGSCTEFATQAEAQRAANTPDGDGDGRYCERLPCPCSGPGAPSETPVGQRPGSGDDGRRTRAVPGEGSFPATITDVIDGDTVDARLANGRRVRVRLLGIDTPEKTTLRAGRAECGGQEATRSAEGLARRWPTVVLRTDPSQDAEDQYGRLLAYVDSAEEPGRSYQVEQLAQGWAKVFVFERDPFGRLRSFRDAAASAQRAGRGVWRSCGGDFRRPLAD